MFQVNETEANKPMRYCPDCKKPYPEEDFNCPDCGYSPVSEHEAETTAKMPVPVTPAAAAAADAAPPADTGTGAGEVPPGPGAGDTNEPGFFKKNSLWLALGAIALVIAIVGGIIIYMLSRSDAPVVTTSPTTTTTRTTDTGVKTYQENLTKSWNTLRDITVELV